MNSDSRRTFELSKIIDNAPKNYAAYHKKLCRVESDVFKRIVGALATELSLMGRPRRRWGDNIKCRFTAIGYEEANWKVPMNLL